MIASLISTAMAEVVGLKAHEDQKVVVIWLPGDYLQLVVINLSTQHFWDRLIRYKQLDEEFKVYFANMQELFNAFKISTSITISHLQDNSGVVISLKVIQKLLKINLDPRDQFYPKRKESGLNVDQQSESYRRKLIELCDQNKRLSIEINHKNQQITQLQIQMSLIKHNYQQMALKMGRIEHELRERAYHQRKQESYVTKMQQNITYHIPLASIEYNRTVQTIKKSSKFEFKPYITQFIKNFKIQNSRIKLQKQFKDFYQVCSDSPLPQQGRINIKIQIIHTKASNIYFGLMKQSRRKQKFTCQHKEAISYRLKGGKFLYEDGYQTGEEIPCVKQNQVLSFLVDNEGGEVSWTLKQKYMIKRKLPQSMQKCPLYVFVSLHDEGDEVELK